MVVLAAVKQYKYALKYASAALRNGGLESHVRCTLSKFDTSMRVFVGTFLCAARLPPAPADSANSEAVRARSEPMCILEKLNYHGIHHAIVFKKAIAEYAGVQMKGPFVALRGAAQNCGWGNASA